MSLRTLSFSLCLLTVCPSLAGDCDRTFQTPVRYGVGGEVRDIKASDLDSDGRPDLVVAADAGAELTILLNRAENGFVFGDPVPLPGGAVRLFQPDTHRLVAVGRNYLATIFPNGDATFRSVVTTISGDNLLQYAVASADFNADGQDDIAIGVTRGNRTGFLRVFHGALDGSFSEPAPAMQLDRQIWALSAGEFTGDTEVDLVFADRTIGAILPGNGNGTFAARVIVQTVLPPQNVVTGDFDGDGRADFLFGSYLHLTTAALKARRTSITFGASAVVDIDQDGKLDILSSSAVYRGNGDGTFQEVSAGAVGPLTGRQTWADFDLDGHLDVAAGTTDDVTIRYGRGGGRLDGGSSYAAGDGLWSLLTGDIDNDGRDDVVTHSFDGTYVHLADPDGTLNRTAHYSVPSATNAAALGDFDGDGKLDLLYSTAGISFGAGDGTFAAPVVNGATSSGPVATGDLNGDGKLDAAYARQPGVRRLIGDGSGGFSSSTETALGEVASITTADFNRDGRDDIVVNTGALHIIDSAVPSAAIEFASGLDPYEVVAADVDGDSFQDVLAISLTNTLLIFGGNGNGTFRSPHAIPVEAGSFGSIAVADFTGDGLPDLVVTRQDTYVAQLLAQQADGSFIETARIPNGHMTGVESADFDADGYPDIVMIAARDSLIAAHLNRCRDQLRVAEPRVSLSARGRTLTVEVPNDAQGSVTFHGRLRSDDFWKRAKLATVPVVGGRATLTTTLPLGEHVFWAIYSGAGRYARSDASPLMHAVSETTSGGKRRAARH
ncbi:MAG: FG-GAP-like repeat-containing protein [Thermoanaerobaculia bacterium]